MKNPILFIIKKSKKKIDNFIKQKQNMALSEKEENILYKLIRIHGKNYSKIAYHFNSHSLVRISTAEIKEIINSKSFKFKSKKNYWTPEEERILLEKHSIYGNKWSVISNFLEGRSDNNIKNYFYSKFRRELRKIIKELFKDRNFLKNYIQSGIIAESKITVNNIYKLLKKNDISFENVNKQIVYKLLAVSENFANVSNSESTHENNDLNNCVDIPFPNKINPILIKCKPEEEKIDDYKEITISDSSCSSDSRRYDDNLHNSYTLNKNIYKCSTNNYFFFDQKLNENEKKICIDNFEELTKNDFNPFLIDDNNHNSHECFSYLNL